MYDLIIKNGTIIDGTGQKMFQGDIGVKDGLIRKVGNLQNESAEQIINAKGQYVTPGFLDVNNHSDTYWRLFLDPEMKSLVYQGITTIIGGNCGSSLAPLANKETIQSIQKWADLEKINLNWMTMKEFLNEVERRKIAINFGTLIGHGTIRRGLVSDERRAMDDSEIKVAQKMTKKAMNEGALGISTGLVYTHAKQASVEEIAALVKTVSEQGGIYVTHLREEGTNLKESVQEAISVSREAGARLHISHFKAMGEKNWNLQEQAITLIERARSEGLDITFDVYPYAATGSVLYTLLPDWVSEGGKKMMVHRLKDPALRKEVLAEMKESGFEYSEISVAISPLNKNLNRKKISDLAEAQGKSLEETIIDLLIASDGKIIATMDVLNEENVKKAIKHPLSIIVSNGSGYDLEYKNTGNTVHPRSFGSFPRVLGKYVREEKLLTWEEAIHKMTGKPAKKFNLKKRGIIKEGNGADLVVFDPEKIREKATFNNPYQYSEGIDWVVVNGEVILQKGNYNGRRVGRVIRNDDSKIF